MTEVEQRPWPRDSRYQVRSDGTILGPSGRELKSTPSPDGYGYRLITLRTSTGRRIGTSVHRVVCETFHGPCPSGMQVAHEDGNGENCRADNLSWKMPSPNNQDKLAHGTYGRRLTRAEALEIRAQPDASRNELAERYGVTPGTISHIRTGYTWRAA